MAFAAGPPGRFTGVNHHPLVGCHKEGTTQYGYQWGERYDRGSILVTTNLEFARWNELFGDGLRGSGLAM